MYTEMNQAIHISIVYVYSNYSNIWISHYYTTVLIRYNTYSCTYGNLSDHPRLFCYLGWKGDRWLIYSNFVEVPYWQSSGPKS